MRRRIVAYVALAAAFPVSAQPAPGSFRVRDLNPVHGAAVERALAGAARRLESAECRRIFTDFRSTSGAPLQEGLQALGLEAPDYLSLIVFTDGFGRRSCQGSSVMAITAPGSRVVYVCGRRFWEAEARSPERAELVVLHEALHTLGLGENPPSDPEITRGVRERCAL
jgi:hypothetical protein